MPVEEMQPRHGESNDFVLQSSGGSVTDLGDGFVATEWSSEYTMHGQQGVTFDHCASGLSFSVVTYEWNSTGERRLSLDAIATMRNLIQSPTEVTLEMAQGRFVEFASPIDRVAVESCGCAAFYPEMRGDLEPN